MASRSLDSLGRCVANRFVDGGVGGGDFGQIAGQLSVVKLGFVSRFSGCIVGGSPARYVVTVLGRAITACLSGMRLGPGSPSRRSSPGSRARPILKLGFISRFSFGMVGGGPAGNMMMMVARTLASLPTREPVHMLCHNVMSFRYPSGRGMLSWNRLLCGCVVYGSVGSFGKMVVTMIRWACIPGRDGSFGKTVVIG